MVTGVAVLTPGVSGNGGAVPQLASTAAVEVRGIRRMAPPMALIVYRSEQHLSG